MFLGFLFGSASKESTRNVGDQGSILGLGRATGEGKGCLFQYFVLENSMDYIGHWVANSWTQLSNFHFHIQFIKALVNTALVQVVCSQKSG